MTAHPDAPDCTVSIALTTYNGERYLDEQLQSFLKQSVGPDEVVVSDDGSTDATLDICRDFAAAAPFAVKILTGDTTVGYTRNFERAINGTTGDVVFLSDQDDVWYDNKIEVMTSRLTATESAQLIIHDLRFCDGSLSPSNQTKLSRISAFRSPMRGYITGMATAVRRSFLRMSLPVPDGVAYDSWIHGCARVLGAKEVISEVLADYRRHDANVTGDRFLNNGGTVRNQDVLRSEARKHTLEEREIIEREARSLLAWLVSRTADLQDAGIASAVVLNRAKAALETEIRWMQYRDRTLRKPRPFRLPRILRQYLLGGYRPFSGGLSAAKDLVVR